MTIRVDDTSRLSPQQRKDLLVELLSGRSGEPGVYPVSPAQQRLWLLDQIAPANAAYNLPVGLFLKGPVDLHAMRQSLQDLIRRHETLRTSFQMRHGQPVQVVAPELQVQLPVVDLSATPATGRFHAARALADAEVQSPFTLEQGPLWRLKLIRLSRDQHILICTMHHIVSDAWSLGIFLRELGELYQGYCSDTLPVLPELSLQYGDYARRQIELLSGGVAVEQTAYWRRQLHGVPPVLQLPSDRVRPPEQTFDGATQIWLVPPDLVLALEKLALSQHATLFMVMLAAFKVLLHRYTGAEDIVVGVPVAGRTHVETEALIGFFVNTLVLRTGASGSTTFRDFLGRVRDATLEALAHSDVPFERLVEDLQPQRSLSYNPVFQIMFSAIKAAVQARSLGPLTSQPYGIDTRRSLVDLSVSVIEGTDNERWVQLEYNTALFDHDRIFRMLGHYFNLLRAVVSNPSSRIADLRLLDEDERRRLLVEFNNTHVEFSPDTCVHRLFEEQVRRTPQAAALICGAERLSYRQLNERANRLAHDLIRRGVGPETPVAIFALRSSALVTGILAVLKASGAYVPLDSREPRARLAEMFEQMRPPVVLTQAHLAHRLPDHSCTVVDIDADRVESGAEFLENPPDRATPSNLAYILFTSGSTGKPKGVAVEHRNASSFVRWASSVFEPAELARTLFSTSISFDLSVFELFVPLSAGGAAVLAENILELPSLVAADEITLINTVPSAMKEVVRHVPPSVKVINLAGEPLPDGLVRQLYDHTAVEKVYNLYGPTEVTTYSTYALLGRHDAVTIGRPITNTRAYVLDTHGEIVPIGIAGELHLSGSTVARGYYGRPDLTEQRFLPNSYGAPGFERMYRTGDLCRYLPDGRIQHLGRLDHQVKVRGFRIELEEIEAALDGHSSVRRAAVAVHESSARGKRLVAYVVPARGGDFDADELRAAVGRKLPDYMVPDYLVPVDDLPLTTAGKIDRSSLPKPDLSLPPTNAAAAPRDSLEDMLVTIWQDVLGVPNLGVRDNFFDLGGHSLLAARMMFDVHQAIGRRIPLSALLRGPTIEKLAESIRTGSADQLDPVIMPIQRGNRGLPLFVVAAPGVETLGYVLLARHMADHPVYKIQGQHRSTGPGPLYADADLERLARDYIAALRVVQSSGPYCIAGMCEGAHITERMVLQLEAQHEEVALFAIFDTWVLQNSTVRPLLLLELWRELVGRHLNRRGYSRILRLTGRQIRARQWYRLGQAVTKRLRKLLTGGVDRPHTQALWPGRAFHPATFAVPVLLFKQPRHPYYHVNDPQLGWGKRCRSTVETCVVSAGHEDILREPAVAVIAERLVERLQDISAHAAHRVATTPSVTDRRAGSTWPQSEAS